MASLSKVDSATNIKHGDTLKAVQQPGEDAAAKGVVDNSRTDGPADAEETAKDREGVEPPLGVRPSEEIGDSAEQEGRGESRKDEEVASEHDTTASESEIAKGGESATSTADEAGKDGKDSKASQKDHENDSKATPTSDPDDQGSIPPFGEAISAAEESISEAYLELGFHLADTSDEKTRKVLQTAMESVMKAARKIKVVEKAGEEMMRESEGKQEQPAKSVGHPPAAMLNSVPTQVQEEQCQQPLAVLEVLRQLLQQPRTNSASPTNALPGSYGTASTQGPSITPEGPQPRRAQSSSHPNRKSGELELMTSKPYIDWADRSNVISPGPKTFCISASSGERPPAKPSPGSSLDQVVKEANPLFNFVKQRSLHNASEEGKSVAFMTAFAHSHKQRRATILRCVTKKEAGEEGRKWSTQELREHRL